MRLFPAILLLFVAAALPCCILDTGKSDMPPPSDADSGEDFDDAADGEDGETITPAEICRQAFEVMCDYVGRCCSESDKALGEIVIYSLYVGTDCSDPERSQLYNDCVTELGQSLALGRSLR